MKKKPWWMRRTTWMAAASVTSEASAILLPVEPRAAGILHVLAVIFAGLSQASLRSAVENSKG